MSTAILISTIKKCNKLYRLKNIERLYYDLFEKRISIKDFEQTIYHEAWPKLELSQEEYEGLICLDYSDKDAKYQIKKVMGDQINHQYIEHNRLNNLFDDHLKSTLNWKIETNEYGTRYGITTSINSYTYFTFVQPIDRSIHPSSPYQTKQDIYMVLEDKLNARLPDIPHLKTFIADLISEGILIFCYLPDVDQFSRYYNDDNSEIQFHEREVHGKIKKEGFMKKLNL